jgi:hypothetical protein
MEIIAELEPVARGVYCGAIGYWSVTGAMDTSVAIRTLWCATTSCTSRSVESSPTDPGWSTGNVGQGVGLIDASQQEDVNPET